MRNLIRFVAPLFVIATLCTSLCYGEEEEEVEKDAPVGTESEVFAGDLNGDGKPERVLLRKIGNNDRGKYFQLIVKRDQKVIWRGPGKLDDGDSLVFGSWDIGHREPPLFTDIDGDGKPEMVVREPQSDVSPATFKIYKWTGASFKCKGDERSLLESAPGSNLYIWMPYDGGHDGRWVMSLYESEGSIGASIMGGGRLDNDIMAVAPRGLKVKR